MGLHPACTKNKTPGRPWSPVFGPAARAQILKGGHRSPTCDPRYAHVTADGEPVGRAAAPNALTSSVAQESHRRLPGISAESD